MSLVAAVRAALLPAGLNLIAALPMQRYDGDVPERYQLRKRYAAGKSLIVIGNGGGEFWDGFRRCCAAQLGFFERAPHPLDRYTVDVIERQVRPLLARAGVIGHVLYPFRFEADPVSFVHLGAVAGLGARSRLGVLVHPEYGPWIAMRAAVLLESEVDPTPVAPFDPCGTCTDQPCIGACPAAAISDRGWDVPACTSHRLATEGNCADRCHARWHCAYGRAHRYPEDALAYHQGRALTAMRTQHGA
jgi:epoxyqueuosine reductase